MKAPPTTLLLHFQKEAIWNLCKSERDYMIYFTWKYRIFFCECGVISSSVLIHLCRWKTIVLQIQIDQANPSLTRADSLSHTVLLIQWVVMMEATVGFWCIYKLTRGSPSASDSVCTIKGHPSAKTLLQLSCHGSVSTRIQKLQS